MEINVTKVIIMLIVYAVAIALVAICYWLGRHP
jgi:hypothetical protein